jgi:hypothetical protein
MRNLNNEIILKHKAKRLLELFNNAEFPGL